jgi:hypothetical protein
MDTDGAAESLPSIHRYQSILGDCTAAEAKVILRELIDELEEKLAPPSDYRVPPNGLRKQPNSAPDNEKVSSSAKLLSLDCLWTLAP